MPRLPRLLSILSYRCKCHRTNAQRQGLGYLQPQDRIPTLPQGNGTETSFPSFVASSPLRLPSGSAARITFSDVLSNGKLRFVCFLKLVAARHPEVAASAPRAELQSKNRCRSALVRSAKPQWRHPHLHCDRGGPPQGVNRVA